MICFEYIPLEIPETPRKLEPPPFLLWGSVLNQTIYFLGGGGSRRCCQMVKTRSEKKKSFSSSPSWNTQQRQFLMFCGLFALFFFL